MSLTARDLIDEIDCLPKGKAFEYVHPPTKTLVQIVDVTLPDGPILIKRFNPSNEEDAATAIVETISSEMLWRIANAFAPGVPINLDRVLAASYNTRSALEALLAHTPQFHVCYPGRIEVFESSSRIQKGHKHLLWEPDNLHPLGEIHRIETDIVISEIPHQLVYDPLTVPPLEERLGDANLKRRHALIQIALIEIGRHFGCRSWIAKNDQSIVYRGQPLREMEEVIPDLSNAPLIGSQLDAVRAASYVDCIWFQGHKLMPAVMEIEDSTGVTSGLTRMQELQYAIPSINTRYVIVAPDEDREKVIHQGSRRQFRSLRASYFPYSAVEELLSLCRRRGVGSHVGIELIEAYMTEIVS